MSKQKAIPKSRNTSELSSASLEDLIAELQSRGYLVKKKNTSTA